MAEINNNIPKFAGKVEKTERHQSKKGAPCECNQCESQKSNYVPDTGVLGRSQVVGKPDITKSVDAAVHLAKHNPGLLCGCESVFDSLYNSYIASGMSEADAYAKALLGEEELINIGAGH